MTRGTGKATLGPEDDAEKEPGSILYRALQVFDLVASSERALTVPEMSAALGVPKPTLHRLVSRLEDQGYLAREPTGRHFRPGAAFLRMSFAVLQNSGVAGQRHAILEKLVEEIGETCNFTMLAGNTVLYLDRVEARWPLRLYLEPGSRVPIHCTASGKLLLAALDEVRRDRVLSMLPLTAQTLHTITSRPSLEEELSRIAERGYSIDDQEFLLGLIAIAVPVVTAEGRTVAAVACHAPNARLTIEQAVSHLPKLREAAAEIAATLTE